MEHLPNPITLTFIQKEDAPQWVHVIPVKPQMPLTVSVHYSDRSFALKCRTFEVIEFPESQTASALAEYIDTRCKLHFPAQSCTLSQ
jgi:uncharacterized protein YpmS